MAFVGFFFTLLLGLFMIYWGVQVNRLSLGFLGSLDKLPTTVLILGVFLVYVAVHFAPFTITVTQ